MVAGRDKLGFPLVNTSLQDCYRKKEVYVPVPHVIYDRIPWRDFRDWHDVATARKGIARLLSSYECAPLWISVITEETVDDVVNYLCHEFLGDLEALWFFVDAYSLEYLRVSERCSDDGSQEFLFTGGVTPEFERGMRVLKDLPPEKRLQ
jgi:hypothetical protein